MLYIGVVEIGTDFDGSVNNIKKDTDT